MKAAPINDLNCTATKKVREVQLLGNSEQQAADADDGLEVDLLLLLHKENLVIKNLEKNLVNGTENYYDSYSRTQKSNTHVEE